MKEQKSLRSLLPLVLAHGQVTDVEVDIDTLAERVAHELKEAAATYWGPETHWRPSTPGDRHPFPRRRPRHRRR